MTSFVAIVRVTLRQLTGRKRVFGFGLLSLIPAGLLYFAARARLVEGLDTDLGGLGVSPFFSMVLPLTALILAGSALGDERRDMTLPFLVLRPISRLGIATAKTLAACTASLAFALVGTVALTLVYAAAGGRLNVMPAIFVGAAVVCVAYSALFVLLGNVTSRPTVVGILYIVFVENVLVDELPRIAPMSPWRIGLSATIDWMPGDFPARALLGAIGDLPLSAANAFLATGGIVVVSIALGAILLSRTDSV